MTIKDMTLLENLLEEFITRSEYCKDCPYKHIKEDRQYCFFGIKCITENFLLTK